MYRSATNLARFRDLFRMKFWKRRSVLKEAAPETAAASGENTAEDDEKNELNLLRARGVLKHLRPYTPPSDLEQRLLALVSETVPSLISQSDPKSLLDLSFMENGGNDVKFQIFSKAEAAFGKRIPSSYLHELKTFNDLLEFYRVPANNVTQYIDLARSKDLPRNLHISEEPKRYHPLEDGQTALPGVSRYVTDLRERQFDKGFRAKTEWHHYQDKHFDYTQSPPNCPWDKKKADRYDVNNFRRRPDFP